MRYGVVVGGSLVNVIELASPDVLKGAKEYSNASFINMTEIIGNVGDVWNSQTKSFTAPVLSMDGRKSYLMDEAFKQLKGAERRGYQGKFPVKMDNDTLIDLLVHMVVAQGGDPDEAAVMPFQDLPLTNRELVRLASSVFACRDACKRRHAEIVEAITSAGNGGELNNIQATMSEGWPSKEE